MTEAFRAGVLDWIDQHEQPDVIHANYWLSGVVGHRLKHDLGWVPKYDFEGGLTATIRWYLDHGDWITAVTGGKYALERLGLG